MTESDQNECPICGAESEVSWRCTECGKLFNDGGDSGGNRNVVGGGGS